MDSKREADYEIISMTGGQKDNAITREAVCDILVSKEEMDAIKAYASKVEKGLREEYDGSDKGISIQITEAGHESAKVLHPTSREKCSVLSDGGSFRYPENECKYRRPCRNLYQYWYCISL